MELAEVRRCIEARDFAALAVCRDFRFDAAEAGLMLEAAIACKIANALDVAERLLSSLRQRVPDYASGHYEWAVMQRNAKRVGAAVIGAETAVRLAPSSFRFGLFYAHMLFANGAWDEARRQLESTVTYSEDDRLELQAMREFGDYLKEFPKQRALYLTRKLTEKYRWLTPSAVVDRIGEAIAERRPFALIRLGDGDGAHFRVGPEDEARYPNLQRYIRKNHTEFLLGTAVDPVFTGYASVTSTLQRYAMEADILGVPYPSWLEHEYDISSPITMACLMNINRCLYENDRVDHLALCDQLIHMQLHEGGLLDPVLRRLPSLTVISCLESLPDRIQEKFGVPDVDLIRIPSETYAPHLYGEARLPVSLHYPHAFWPTVQLLSRPHDGRVFVIAAGTFGKFYATIIKRHGGIALDLGSLVDGWMKMVSRPGYEKFAAEP